MKALWMFCCCVSLTGFCQNRRSGPVWFCTAQNQSTLLLVCKCLKTDALINKVPSVSTSISVASLPNNNHLFLGGFSPIINWLILWLIADLNVILRLQWGFTAVNGFMSRFSMRSSPLCIRVCEPVSQWISESLFLLIANGPTAFQLYLHISCCCLYRETFYLQNEFVF